MTNQAYTRDSSHNERPPVLDNFLKDLNRQKPPAFTPEYSYQRFFFIPPQERRGTTFTSSTARNIAKEQLNIAKSILSASDKANVVFYFKDEATRDLYINYFKTLDPDIQSYMANQRLTFKVGNYTKDIWAQDLGEPTGGQMNIYTTGWPNPWHAAVKQREAPFTGKDSATRQIPAVLQGGNLTKTTLNGKRIIIVGSDDVFATKQVYKKEYNYDISTEEITNLYKKSFGADQVIVLGEDKFQPPKLFHIDNAVFFPKDGVAIMVEFPAAPVFGFDKRVQSEVREALASYEKQLRAAGFKIIKIPSTFDHIRSFQAYTNAIPITADGKTTLLMPSFGDQELESRIRAKLEKEGFKIQFIKDFGYDSLGNVHCLTGSLAMQEADVAMHKKSA